MPVDGMPHAPTTLLDRKKKQKDEKDEKDEKGKKKQALNHDLRDDGDNNPLTTSE